MERDISTIYHVSLISFGEYNAYFLDEILIVFNSKNNFLHLLDELSAWLFLSLDAGLSEETLKCELIENQIDVKLLKSTFEKIDNLLHTRHQNAVYQHEYDFLITSPSVAPTISSPIISMVLLDKKFQVYSNCKRFMTYLKTLSLVSDLSFKESTDYHVEVLILEGRYQLSCNGLYVKDIAKFKNIMPTLMDPLQVLAYQSSDYLLSVNSAMLEINGKGLMLPGLSGSGKSTLAVSLLSQGYQCYSDEVAVISVVDDQLMPLPLPAAIKSGSWDVIQNSFPNIESLIVWARADGRRSKYIDLPHSYYNLPNIPINCIVFPHYQADAKSCELLPINSISALEELTKAGYQIKDSLTKEKVEQILHWIANISAYHLTYSNLNDAHQVINKLMSSA